MIATARGKGRVNWRAGLAGCLLAAALAGCSQTTSAPTPMAKSDFVDPGQPLVLTGGTPDSPAAAEKPKDQANSQPLPAGKEPRPAAKPDLPKSDATRDVAPPEPAPAPVVALPEGAPADAAPSAAVALPGAAEEPASPPEPPQSATAAIPEAEAAPAPSASGEYPNINTAPAEPEGKLLSPDERKKLIMKLNALARRQGGKTTESGKPCPEGATEAECKAAIE